jgi:hypothetical protein
MKFFKVGFFLFTLEKIFFKRLKVGNFKYIFFRDREDVKIMFTFCDFFHAQKILFLFNFSFLS